MPPEEDNNGIHPAECVQIKMEVSEDQIKLEEESEEEDAEEDLAGEPQDFEMGSESESNDDEEPGHILCMNDNVLFQIIYAHNPPSAFISQIKRDMNGEQCIVYLPKFDSFRCERCFRSHIKTNYNRNNAMMRVKGIELSKNGSFHQIIQHLSSYKHTLSNPIIPVKMSRESDSNKLYINEDTIALIASKFKLIPSLKSTLEADSRGNQSLVYLPQEESIRCERCFRSNPALSSDLSTGIEGKRGISLNSSSAMNYLNVKIRYHFISDQHAEVVTLQKKIEEASSANVKGNDETFSSGISALNSNEIHSSASDLSNDSSISTGGWIPFDPQTIEWLHSRVNLNIALIDILKKDWEGERSLRYFSNNSGPGNVRCETCCKDEGVQRSSSKGGLVKDEGILFIKEKINLAHLLERHLSSQRHLQIISSRRSQTPNQILVKSEFLNHSSISNEIQVDIKEEEMDDILPNDAVLKRAPQSLTGTKHLHSLEWAEMRLTEDTLALIQSIFTVRVDKLIQVLASHVARKNFIFLHKESDPERGAIRCQTCYKNIKQRNSVYKTAPIIGKEGILINLVNSCTLISRHLKKHEYKKQ